MKRSEQEKLLREILPVEDMADFEQASPERGLTCLRQRRRKSAMRAQIFSVMGVVLVAILLKRHNHLSREGAGAPLASATAPAVASQVKFISDEELLALFPDRPVALIGKPGQQRLVFLDEPKEDSARAPF
jgi:hypothetical protein